MKINELEKEIIESCNIAQVLIIELYEKYPNHKAFEQCNLINGLITVYENVYYGEYETAIDHLLYMIYESYIDYPLERKEKIHSFFNMQDFYFQNNKQSFSNKNIELLSNQSFSNKKVENLKLEYYEYKNFKMTTIYKQYNS